MSSRVPCHAMTQTADAVMSGTWLGAHTATAGFLLHNCSLVTASVAGIGIGFADAVLDATHRLVDRNAHAVPGHLQLAPCMAAAQHVQPLQMMFGCLKHAVPLLQTEQKRDATDHAQSILKHNGAAVGP